MPYIIGTMRYPSHKQLEIVKIWLKIDKKYPDNEDIAVQLCAPVITDENGILIMGIYDVKKGQLEKAFKFYSRLLHEFISIEGYEYKVRVWNTFDEALAIGGIEVPE